METVGIRELKENLGRYMKRIRAGERFIVSDRKKEIAIIMPLKKGNSGEKIYQLIQSGIAIWHGGRPAGMPERVVSRGKSVSEAVIEDRR